MDTPQLPPIPPPDQGNDKLLAILCHVSLMLGVGFILPLIVYLVKRGESAFCRGPCQGSFEFSHLAADLFYLRHPSCIYPDRHSDFLRACPHVVHLRDRRGDPGIRRRVLFLPANHPIHHLELTPAARPCRLFGGRGKSR